MIEPPEPGIYEDVSFATYRQWDAVNASFLKVVAKQSPAHAQYEREHPTDSTALAFGRMLHTLCVETLDFATSYAIAPDVDRRTKAGKAALAEFEALSADKEVIKQADYDTARAMAKAIRAHPKAKIFLSDGRPEVCAVWDDDEAGIRCKGRYDHLHNHKPVIADIKSTRDATARPFQRSIIEYGYHLSAAFYLDGLHALTGQRGSFVWIAAEKSEPWGVITYHADARTIEAGRHAYKRALFVVKQCMETRVWPCYSQELVSMTIPDWLIRQEGVEELAS